MRTTFSLLVLIATLVLHVSSLEAVTIDFVTVGNPGNAPDTRYDATGFGAVDYTYRIGKTEVTNAQYVDFLNAVASTDPYGLYDLSMGSTTVGGITRSGSQGSYTYAVKGPAINGAYSYDTKPVVFVSWYDAIRFTNWLHNGQGGPETTEQGAYTLLGGTAIPSNGSSIARNPGAKWFLPSEDEWYKAAYHKNDGATGDYWDYPTNTNLVPNNNPPSGDTGNSANFFASGYPGGSSSFPLTDAGAYTLSASPYGTYDQGGNVWEWNETAWSSSTRVERGGAWVRSFGPNNLKASARFGDSPTLSFEDLGFRVATIVPEPAAFVLFTTALVTVACRPRL